MAKVTLVGLVITTADDGGECEVEVDGPPDLTLDERAQSALMLLLLARQEMGRMVASSIIPSEHDASGVFYQLAEKLADLVEEMYEESRSATQAKTQVT